MALPGLFFRGTVHSACGCRCRPSREAAVVWVLPKRRRLHSKGHYQGGNYSFLRPKKGRTGAGPGSGSAAQRGEAWSPAGRT
jgi:hypothetical protein